MNGLIWFNPLSMFIEHLHIIIIVTWSLSDLDDAPYRVLTVRKLCRVTLNHIYSALRSFIRRWKWDLAWRGNRGDAFPTKPPEFKRKGLGLFVLVFFRIWLNNRVSEIPRYTVKAFPSPLSFLGSRGGTFKLIFKSQSVPSVCVYKMAQLQAKIMETD